MRLAILSDIHEDIISLYRAFEIIRKMEVDKIACLGDICGFSVPFNQYSDTRNANTCLRILKENCDIVLAGNHDFAAIQKLSETIDFLPKNWFELDYFEKKRISENRVFLYEENELTPFITKGDKKYISTLSCSDVISDEEKNILLSHYFYPNESGFKKGFFHESKDLSNHFSEMEKRNASLSFVGHSHHPGILFFTIGKRYFKTRKSIKIPTEPTCFCVPAVCRGKDIQGFLILDTDEMKIENIKI